MFHSVKSRDTCLSLKVREMLYEFDDADDVFGEDNAPIWILYGRYRKEIVRDFLKQITMPAALYPNDDLTKPLVVELEMGSIFDNTEEMSVVRDYVINRASGFPILIIQKDLDREMLNPRFRAHELICHEEHTPKDFRNL